MSEQTYAQQQREKEKRLDEVLRNLDSDHLPSANIVLAGVTGAGKSTLVNAVFGSSIAQTGVGRPITEEVREYSGGEVPINIWDTVGLELDGERTERSIQSIKQVIGDKAKGDDPFDRVHAIWYCVNSGSRRYQGKELEFIRQLRSVSVPFIIVLTQCVATEEEVNGFEAEIRRMNDQMGIGDVDVVQVLAEDYVTRGGTVPAFGLDELVNVTLKRLPEYIKDGFAAAQRVDKGIKRTHGEKIIVQYVQAAKEGLFDKLFPVNIAVADRRIKNMLTKISGTYGAVLSGDDMDGILKKCHIDFKNVWAALIAPKKKYTEQIEALLRSKKEEGFRAEIEVGNADRVAKMVVCYGYTFIDALEVLWAELTEEDLKKVDVVVKKLILIINEKLKDNRGVV